MQKLSKKLDIFFAKISSHEYGPVYLGICIFFFICAGTVMYDIFFSRGFTFQSCRAALFISGLFNLIIVTLFALKIYDICKDPVRENYTLDEIKQNAKVLKNSSKNYLETLLKEAIKKEDYKVAHVISKQLEKINGKVSID